MRFADMLASSVAVSNWGESKPTGDKRAKKTQKTVDKHRATMQKKRHAKWRKHFMELENLTGTTTRLSNLEGQASSAVYRVLMGLSLEVPPVVEIVGRIPPSTGNGLDQIVWKWIGD